MESKSQYIPNRESLEKKRTIELPPSVEYFNTTEEGKEYKKKIIELLPNIDKSYNFSDAESFKILGYMENAKAKYLIGEDYETEIKKAYDLAYYNHSTDKNLTSVLKNNYYACLLEIYEEFKWPPDQRLQDITKHITNGETDILRGVPNEPNSENVSRILSLKINNNDFTNVADLFGKIKSPYYQVMFLVNFLKTTDNNEQIDNILNKAKNILRKSNNMNIDHSLAVTKLVCALVKHGHENEVEEFLKLMTSPSQKIFALVCLANLEKSSQDMIETFLHKSLEIADTVSDTDPRKNNNYAVIASWYVNKGIIEKADEIFSHQKKELPYEVSYFLDNLSVESLKYNEKTQKYVVEYLSKEKNFNSLQRTIFKKDVIKGFTSMGLVKEAMDLVVSDKESVALSQIIGLVAFAEGINDHLSVTKNKDDKKIIQRPSSAFYEDIFSRSDKAFWAGYYLFGKNMIFEKIPDHIKLAYELGESFYSDDKNPYQLGALHDPQSIRTFLKSMEHYKFEDIPQALESILGALPAEGDKAVYEFIATHPEVAPRLLKVLISIDKDKGTRFALDLISRKNTPDRVFQYFSNIFIKEGRFTRNFKPFLSVPEDLSTIRRLVSQYPNQLNTTIDTFTQLGLKSLSQEETLWDSLNDLGTLTPGIYKKYRSLPPLKQKEFIFSLEKFDYSKFFKNKTLLSKGDNEMFDQDVMLDLMYRAYAPVNMSYMQMKELLPQVKDRRSDLDGYTFPDSYEVSFLASNYVLKEGETINQETIKKINKVFWKDPSEAFNHQRNEAFLKLLRATTDFTEDEINSLFSVLNFLPQVIQAHMEISFGFKNKEFEILSSLKDVFGVLAEDNFGTKMLEKIKKEGKISKRVEQLLESSERRKNLLKALGHQEDNEFTKDIPTIDLVSRLFVEKCLSKYNILINKELRKFILSDKEGQSSKKATAYISKNQGSFFAKSTAGLCTSQDISLWDMKNHFHINTVDEHQMVKGNTMAYIETVAGKKSLVLRGFNPSDSYLKDITAESFVEEMLRVARDFKEKNNLAHMYIIKEGTWSSNRGQVNKYLEKKYPADKAQAIPHTMKVSGTGSVDNILLIE